MVLYTASQYTEKEGPALSTRTHAHDMDQSRCLQIVSRSSFDAEIRWVEPVLEKVLKKPVSILYSKKKKKTEDTC